jgi:predicted acetyltransferase
VTTAEADIGMPISTLGAIYAGDMSLLTLATAGKLDVINPSALQITAAMFLSPSRSWCATWF